MVINRDCNHMIIDLIIWSQRRKKSYGYYEGCNHMVFMKDCNHMIIYQIIWSQRRRKTYGFYEGG